MHILIAALHRPSKPTGVCRHAANLARCLAESDNVSQVTLVIGSWQKKYFKESFSLPSDKIRLTEINIKNGSISRNFWFLFGLSNLAKKISPDIVHLSFPLPFFRSFFPCPVVTTIHDLYPFQSPENFGYKQVIFNRLFLKQNIQGSDALTCVSQTTLNDLNYYFPEVSSRHKKAVVVYNFVDFQKSEVTRPKNFQDIFDTPFVLCVAQHRKNKNLDLLIKAYASLVSEQSIKQKTNLIIIGEQGPETENLKQLIQSLFLTDSVFMFSGIPDNELCWFYKNCELFVIPSSLEGFCIPLIEALYFSCAIVCSNIPIFREIGSSICTYFDLTGDVVKNLKESMIKSLESKSTQETDVHLRFSKTEISTQLLQLYSGLN
jgi:glycosyltransferase involved in cell wall biosynthesis